MIYLDHHASTQVCSEAREAMERAVDRAWANPSSIHRAGRAAKALLEEARGAVARAVGAQAADVVFVGGGTEACNLGVFGIVGEPDAGACEVVTSDVEHPAIERAIAELSRRGARVFRLPVLHGKPFSPEELSAHLGPHTRLVALQWVNHETGTILPVADYARVCAERGVPLLVDGSQAWGKLPVDVSHLGASALVLTSSKIGGPAGAAALWVERCRDLSPVLHGGAQERGRRPGTPNLLALAGFGGAARAVSERLAEVPRMKVLRDRLEAACVALGAVVNGADGPRVASVSNLSFRDWRGDVLVAALDVEGLCASSGAACSSGLGAPSPALRAMYPAEPWRAESALRLSLSPATSEGEVERAIEILGRVIGRARRA